MNKKNNSMRETNHKTPKTGIHLSINPDHYIDPASADHTEALYQYWIRYMSAQSILMQSNCDLTHEQMAAIIGKTHATWSRIVNRKQPISVSELCLLCDFCQISPQDFFKDFDAVNLKYPESNSYAESICQRLIALLDCHKDLKLNYSLTSELIIHLLSASDNKAH